MNAQCKDCIHFTKRGCNHKQDWGTEAVIEKGVCKTQLTPQEAERILSTQK